MSDRRSPVTGVRLGGDAEDGQRPTVGSWCRGSADAVLDSQRWLPGRGAAVVERLRQAVRGRSGSLRARPLTCGFPLSG